MSYFDLSLISFLSRGRDENGPVERLSLISCPQQSSSLDRLVDISIEVSNLKRFISRVCLLNLIYFLLKDVSSRFSELFFWLANWWRETIFTFKDIRRENLARLKNESHDRHLMVCQFLIDAYVWENTTRNWNESQCMISDLNGFTQSVTIFRFKRFVFGRLPIILELFHHVQRLINNVNQCQTLIASGLSHFKNRMYFFSNISWLYLFPRPIPLWQNWIISRLRNKIDWWCHNYSFFDVIVE